MPVARFCILTNRRTGERHSFETVTEANLFLRRKPNYIRHHIYRDNMIWDNDMKECYSAQMLLPRNVSPCRNRPSTSHEQQLCWRCKNAVGGCSWSRNFKPVEGWIATPSVIIVGSEKVDTYFIMKCPQYERG